MLARSRRDLHFMEPVASALEPELDLSAVSQRAKSKYVLIIIQKSLSVLSQR